MEEGRPLRQDEGRGKKVRKKEVRGQKSEVI
jgi:hypothetical protein